MIETATSLNNRRPRPKQSRETPATSISLPWWHEHFRLLPDRGNRLEPGSPIVTGGWAAILPYYFEWIRQNNNVIINNECGAKQQPQQQPQQEEHDEKSNEFLGVGVGFFFIQTGRVVQLAVPHVFARQAKYLYSWY